jgi:hypothetical protein
MQKNWNTQIWKTQKKLWTTIPLPQIPRILIFGIQYSSLDRITANIPTRKQGEKLKITYPRRLIKKEKNLCSE